MEVSPDSAAADGSVQRLGSPQLRRRFGTEHFSGNATCYELKTLDFSLFCKGILTTCGCANSATKMRESNVYLTTPFLG